MFEIAFTLNFTEAAKRNIWTCCHIVHTRRQEEDTKLQKCLILGAFSFKCKAVLYVTMVQESHTPVKHYLTRPLPDAETHKHRPQPLTHKHTAACTLHKANQCTGSYK